MAHFGHKALWRALIIIRTFPQNSWRNKLHWPLQGHWGPESEVHNVNTSSKISVLKTSFLMLLKLLFLHSVKQLLRIKTLVLCHHLAEEQESTFLAPLHFSWILCCFLAGMGKGLSWREDTKAGHWPLDLRSKQHQTTEGRELFLRSSAGGKAGLRVENLRALFALIS